MDDCLLVWVRAIEERGTDWVQCHGCILRLMDEVEGSTWPQSVVIPHPRHNRRSTNLDEAARNDTAGLFLSATAFTA